MNSSLRGLEGRRKSFYVQGMVKDLWIRRARAASMQESAADVRIRARCACTRAHDEINGHGSCWHAPTCVRLLNRARACTHNCLSARTPARA
eukprot:6183651-Pleurochrysis_carterae.AAC.3